MTQLRTILLTAFSIFFFVSNAQRVNIGNDRVKVNIIDLPSNYVQPEQRVYEVVGTSEFELHGWTMGENPSIRIVVQQPLMKMGDGQLTTNKHEKKDKDGNVTSTTYSYYVSSTNTGTRNFSIEGLKNEFVYESTDDEEDDEKVKEEENANPFLAAAGVDPDSLDQIAIDVDLDKQVYAQSVSQSYTHTTPEGKSSSVAWNTFRNNQRNTYYNHRNEFRTYSEREIRRRVNALYGYAPSETYVTIQVIKNDKHPETEKFNQSTDALNQLFGSINASTDVSAMASSFAPLITYYEELAESMSDKDKNELKIKGACLFNIAAIHYVLDQHEECITACDAYMEAARSERQGRLMKRNSERTKALLEFHQMDQRHIF